MIRITLLVIAVALSIRCTGAAERVESEVDGTWEVMGYTQAGKANEVIKGQRYLAVFADGVLTTTRDGQETSKVAFKVDPKSKPKAITLTDANKPNGTTIGIYEVSSFKTGVLTIAIYGDDQKNDTEHPKDFERDADKTVVTYRRVGP